MSLDGGFYMPEVHFFCETALLRHCNGLFFILLFFDWQFFDAEKPVVTSLILRPVGHAFGCLFESVGRGHDYVVARAPVCGQRNGIFVDCLKPDEHPHDFVHVASQRHRVIYACANDAFRVYEKYGPDGFRRTLRWLNHTVGA